mgnify:CR=1 FL=1
MRTYLTVPCINLYSPNGKERWNLTGTVVAFIGLAIILTSLVAYVRRTGDKRVWKQFWAPTDKVTTVEKWVNRAGMAIVMAGLILNFVV